jgi:hypothetical protein
MRRNVSYLLALLAAASLVFALAANGSPRNHQPRHHQPPAKKPAKAPASAYAFVVPGEVSLNVAPVLVAQRSHNIVSVSSPAAGLFCLKAAASINTSKASWVASPEVSRSDAAGRPMFAFPDASGAGCPAGQLAVRTYVSAAVGGALQPSEHVAFMVIVMSS